jgi:ATP-binding cassette, subfamily C, bacterial CydD
MSDGSTSTHRRLLAYNRRARNLLYFTVATGCVSAALVVALAWLLAGVVGRVFVDGDSLPEVAPIIAAMAALAVVRGIVVGGGDLLAQRSASHLKGSLRADLTRHILALGPAFTRAERTGEIVNAATRGVEDLDEYVTQYQPLRFLVVLVPALVALVILVIDPFTVLILLVTGPLVVLFLALIGSRARAITERRFLELGWMSASFLDLLQGLATLKMFGRSRDQVETIRDVSRQYGKTTMEVLRTAFETAFVLEMSTTIAMALVAVEIGLRLVGGGIPYSQALALLILTPEFFSPLRQLSLRYHAGAAGKTAADRIFAVLDTPLAQACPAPSRSAVPLIGTGVRFENVDFSYDRALRPALQDFSLNMTDGQSVALVGETGAGKTTVASLLLRFIEPDRGAIWIGGTPLSSLDARTWRACVGWVPQNPHLFYGTVADNIRLARPGATDEEVVAAAQAAAAHGFIARLALGYNTQIGENGAWLSGGEQQRLAIARAFLKDAPLLILDEPTSQLDSETEAMVQDALARLMRGRTVLIISHRLKLAYSADRIVVLERGRAVEIGTNAALLSNGGPYRALVTAHEGSGA